MGVGRWVRSSGGGATSVVGCSAGRVDDARGDGVDSDALACESDR
jgi:hypothetical protein